MANPKKNINSFHYPKQYKESLGSRVKVSLDYDTENPVLGTIIRNDAEEPYRTIIKLDDGKVIIASESAGCYQMLSGGESQNNT